MNDPEAGERFTSRKADIVSKIIAVFFAVPQINEEASAMEVLYEKDYKQERDQPDQTAQQLQEAAEDLEMFEEFLFYLKNVSKHVIPEVKADYDYLLARCDQYAQSSHGRICGSTNIEEGRAKIEVALPHFFEFRSEDERLFLQEIAEKGRSVYFAPDAKGVIMTIYFDYYGEDESFGNFIAGHFEELLLSQGMTMEDAAERFRVDLETFKRLFGKRT